MKTYTLFFCILFSFASQSETLAEATCRENHGTIKNISSQTAKLQFCFFHYAGMEIETFAKSRFASYAGPEANRAYRQTPQYDLNACERFGGHRVHAKDEQGFAKDFCEFYDRSAIDYETLVNGLSSPWNQDLNWALGIF